LLATLTVIRNPPTLRKTTVKIRVKKLYRLIVQHVFLTAVPMPKAATIIAIPQMPITPQYMINFIVSMLGWSL